MSRAVVSSPMRTVGVLDCGNGVIVSNSDLWLDMSDVAPLSMTIRTNFDGSLSAKRDGMGTYLARTMTLVMVLVCGANLTLFSEDRWRRLVGCALLRIGIK